MQTLNCDLVRGQLERKKGEKGGAQVPWRVPVGDQPKASFRISTNLLAWRPKPAFVTWETMWWMQSAENARLLFSHHIPWNNIFCKSCPTFGKPFICFPCVSTKWWNDREVVLMQGTLCVYSHGISNVGFVHLSWGVATPDWMRGRETRETCEELINQKTKNTWTSRT